MPMPKQIARLSIVKSWMDKALDSQHGIKVEGMQGKEAIAFRQQFYAVRSRDAELARKSGMADVSAYDTLVFRIIDEGRAFHIAKGETIANTYYTVTELDEKEADVLNQAPEYSKL